LVWPLWLLVGSVYREVLTGLLQDLVFLVEGGFKIDPLMDQVFQFLLVLELFLLGDLYFGRGSLFVGEKVVKFCHLGLDFGADQFALGMMERDLHWME
jgi:hypothetical protein